MGGRQGVLDLFSVSIVVAFFCCTVLWTLILAGVYMGVCVVAPPSVRVKKKRIREIYDYVNWGKGRPLLLWAVKSTSM